MSTSCWTLPQLRSFKQLSEMRIGFFTDTFPLLPFLLPPVAGAIGWVLLLSPRAGYVNGIGVLCLQRPHEIVAFLKTLTDQ